MEKMRGPLPRRRRIRLALVAIGLATTITLLGAEILVRTSLRYNTPDTVRENSLQYLPSIFSRHRLKPEQRLNLDEAWGIREGSEPTGRTYSINDAGYRGPSLKRTKPEDEVRVVILGGSAVFDPNASAGEDWPHRVQTLLASEGHGEVVVVNAGVPGHASFDSLGRLYAQIWTYEPDFVLVYNAWNDIKYFSELTGETPLITLFTPYDPKADPLRNYRGFVDRLLSHSQLYVKLRNHYYQRKLRPGPEGQIPEGGSERTYGRLAVDQYRLNIEMIVDVARNIGADAVLLTQATLVAPDNDEEDRERINYEYQRMSHETLVRAFADCNDVIRSVAREKGVPLLDLAGMLGGRPELFEDHVHLSSRGSAAIAAEVAGFLADRLDGRPR